MNKHPFTLLVVIAIVSTLFTDPNGQFIGVAWAQPQATELLSNPDMEHPGGWEPYAIGSPTLPKIEISSTDKHAGAGSLHAVIVRGAQEWPGLKSAPFATQTGKRYRVNFWMKVVSGATGVMMRDGENKAYSSFFPQVCSAPVWTQYTGYYNEQNGGDSAWLCFSPPGSNAEFYLDDVSVKEVDSSRDAVLAAWRHVFPNQPYVYWQRNSPWDNLDRLQAPPDDVKPCHSIEQTMAREEYASNSFVVTNLSDKDMTFKVTASAGPVQIVIRQAMWVTASNGNSIDDALPLLRHDLVVPSGESREIWLTLHSAATRAGTYIEQIRVDGSGQPETSVALHTTVYPVVLPEDKPIYTTYWDYTVPTWIKTPGKARALIEDLRQHYCNVATAHPWVVPRLQVDSTGKLVEDYTELDAALENYKPLRPRMILFCWNREGYFEKQVWKDTPAQNSALPAYMSDAWKSLFRVWLGDWVRHMKQKGYGYDRFAMCPDDETLNAAAFEMAKLIKATDPHILMYVNSWGTSVEQATSYARYIDIFSPPLYSYLGIPPYDSAREAALRKAACKPLIESAHYFWTYTNPIDPDPQESSPYRAYRLPIWRAWKAGMTGVGYWIYSYKSHWNSYQSPDGPNWAVVYPADAPDAPAGLDSDEPVITSKRWEATREGVQDYVYLHMLKNAVAAAPPGASTTTVVEAKSALVEVPALVLGDASNEQLAEAGKQRVLRALANLPAGS